MARPPLVVMLQPPNSSSKYVVLAVHVVGTFARRFKVAEYCHALGVAMSGPPRVRSSASDPTCRCTLELNRMKLWNVAWNDSLTRRYWRMPPKFQPDCVAVPKLKKRTYLFGFVSRSWM